MICDLSYKNLPIKSRCKCHPKCIQMKNADIFGIISRNIRIIQLLSSFFSIEDSCKTPKHRGIESKVSIRCRWLSLPKISGWWMLANGRPPSLFLSIKRAVNRHRNTRKSCKCSSGAVTRRARRRSDVWRSPVKHAPETGVACSTQHAVVTADDPGTRGGGDSRREKLIRGHFSSGITESGISRARGRNKAGDTEYCHRLKYVRGSRKRSTGVFTAR